MCNCFGKWICNFISGNLGIIFNKYKINFCLYVCGDVNLWVMVKNKNYEYWFFMKNDVLIVVLGFLYMYIIFRLINKK